MLKIIYTVFTSPLGLPIDAVWEWLILIIVEDIAFTIAYEASPGGKFGSIIHWIVRAIAFVAIWAMLYGVIYGVQQICQYWVIIISVLGGIVFIAGILTTTVFIIRKNKKAKQPQSIEQPSNDENTAH